MQGKLIEVAYTLRTYWKLFSLCGICKQWVHQCSYSRRLKALNFDNFDNSHNSFLRPEYFNNFFIWKMDPMSGFEFRLVFSLPPRVHNICTQQSTTNVYTSEITFLITSLILTQFSSFSILDFRPKI